MMNDPETLDLTAYLAQGGKLTAPQGMPARYRAELLRLMATFVDSMLAGSAGFADRINDAPGLKERISAARIVLEKTDHAERVLAVMEPFGVDTARYVASHPWAERLDRDADIGATRHAHDMRLAVFNYPLTGWADAVVMNLLMGHAAIQQIADFRAVSYQPLAQAFAAIAPREARHAELAYEGAARLTGQGADLQPLVEYWWPRVAQSFGTGQAGRHERLSALGLRARDGEEQRRAWADAASARLADLGLRAPA